MIVSFFIHLKNRRILSFSFCLRPVESGINLAKLMLQVSHHFNRRPNKASFGCWGSLCARLHSLPFSLAWTDKERPLGTKQAQLRNRALKGTCHRRVSNIHSRAGSEFKTKESQSISSFSPCLEGLRVRGGHSWTRLVFRYSTWRRGWKRPDHKKKKK